MERRTRPTQRQLTRAMRLVGEVRELGVDPPAWKAHMLAGLNDLLGTQVSGVLEHLDSDDFRGGRVAGTLSIGYATDALRLQHGGLIVSGEYFREDPATPDVNPIGSRPFTRLREQMVDPAIWYRSSHAQKCCRPFDIDSYLTSRFPVRALGCVHTIGVSRPWGERRLGERHLRLLHLFHIELGRLWSEDFAPRETAEFARLPPRLRQTLELLAAGDGEKQVARRLGLSRHTVHDYVKALHRCLGVSSRGELLAAHHRRQVRPRVKLECA